jgi:hypothetical protein
MNKVTIKLKDGRRYKFRYVRYISFNTDKNEFWLLRWIYKNNLERRQQEESFKLDEVEYFSVDKMQSYHQW